MQWDTMKLHTRNKIEIQLLIKEKHFLNNCRRLIDYNFNVSKKKYTGRLEVLIEH